MPYYPLKPRNRGYYTKRTAAGTRRYKKRQPYAASVLQGAIRRAIVRNNNQMIETKQSNTTSPDGTEISHNNFVTLSSKLLKTTQGISDPTIFNSSNRIGDKINLKGLKIKMMVELNERYSDVTFRMMVVKCARGDTPTRATLFNDLSGNKMLDTINKERYTILFQKYFKIKAPNHGTVGEIPTLPPGSGHHYANDGDLRLSRATKIVSAWIPGKAFTKSGVIVYNNNTEDPKFFDYHCILYAYSNYSTAQDLWNIARVNDYVATLYYKDA